MLKSYSVSQLLQVRGSVRRGGDGYLKKAANLIASALVALIVVAIHDIDQSDPYEIEVARARAALRAGLPHALVGADAPLSLGCRCAGFNGSGFATGGGHLLA